MDSKSHPFRNLTKQIRKHDAFKPANFSKIAVFYLKLLVQEPFRLLEQKKHRHNIEQHELSKDPIFIIGHWRSGTSFLQYLLGQDPQFGYLNKFEAVFPDVFLHSEDMLKKAARKIPGNFNLRRDAENMSVDLEWDSPSEVEIALTTMISPASPHWGHIFPQDGREYFNKYLFFDEANDAEINQWTQDYVHLIKKISLKNDHRQVLVKSPGNTSRVKKLLELYPNARFIFIHRNPYDIFYSSHKLWHTLLDNLALQPFSKAQMEQKIINIYKKLMRQYVEQRSLIPVNRLTEIRFADFIAEPEQVLKDVYSKLEIVGFENAQPHFQSFLNNRSECKSSSYHHEKHIIKQLNEEWQFAFEEWNYKMKKGLKDAV